MIRSLFGKNPDFIKVYDNALSKRECEILINQFEKSDEKSVGSTSDGYKPDEKECMQFEIDLHDQSVISTIIKPNLGSCIGKYREKYHVHLLYTSTWKLFNKASFQKYDGKEDGYKIWHCEHGSNEENSRRILAWMFYLNDAKCGTEFYDRPTIKAKEGRCVIWPAFWTHTHRGVIPNKGLKYIITGWISYD
tara:strand:- start:47 stop:622 length:576 start_codon:yes stop_codon:yes gene_type:complete